MALGSAPAFLKRLNPLGAEFGCLGIAVLAVVFFTAACVIWYHVVTDPKRRIPNYLQVSRVLYAKEQSWGFGPGGNETGLLVYDLPEPTAAQIASRGLSFFADTGQQPRADGMGAACLDWQTTPVLPESGRAQPAGPLPSIDHHLGRYGFGLAFDAHYIDMANQAIRATGGFYCYCRGGLLLVVSPVQRKVIYAYSG